jgi:hypothetical protein
LTFLVSESITVLQLCNIEVKDVFFLGVVPFGKRDISEKQLEFCNAMNCSFQQANANEESKFYYHCGECFELESWVHFGYNI